MEILKDELRKAKSKVTSPAKVRALSLGAKRSAAVTFDIFSPRDNVPQNAGGDTKSDNEDDDVFQNAQWVYPEEGEESEIEEEDDDEDANDPTHQVLFRKLLRHWRRRTKMIKRRKVTV